MKLLLDLIVIAFLPLLLGRILPKPPVGRILPEPLENARWYTRLLFTVFVLLAATALTLNLCAVALLVLAVGTESKVGETSLLEWIYIALPLLLLLLNAGVLIWARKRLNSLLAIAAAIGMVVSANLLVWAVFLNGLSGYTSEFLLVYCLLTFAVSLAVFIMSGLTTPTPQTAEQQNRKLAARHAQRTARRRDYNQEPDFLNTIDHPRT